VTCPSCGATVQAGATTCPSCLQPVSNSTDSASAVTVPRFSPPVSAAPVSGPTSPTPGSFPRPGSSEEGRARLDRELQAALGPQYRVEDRLGEGGFAVVFLVRDLSLGRRLAVKVLSPDMALSRTGLERFHREAEAIAQLSHPNIVPLHFAGQHGDLVYLAMAFVEGETVAERLARDGALPIADAIRIFREVASALDLAHRQGIVHRDIKPANILLERETGRALVTDFGVARVASAENLTSAGLVVGTPAYFSPEQVGGMPSDGRSDLYSLGLVAYEMLAGSLPFGSPVTQETLIRRLAGPPEPIRQRRPDVPEELDAVVMRCLEPGPENRFQTGADIVRALEGEVVALTGSRKIAERARRRRVAWAAAIGTAVVAVGVGTWVLARSPASPPGPVAPAGMVVIPTGSYLIGSDDSGWARPAHRVALAAFAMDRTEVTVGAYQRFVRETNAEAPWSAEPDSLLPVTGVRWPEASAFCAWRTPGGRLPSEFELEAAARGLEGRRYAWGDVLDTSAAEIGHPKATHPARVASHPRGDTPLGVSDLIGNVWEWTSSRMLAYPGGAQTPGGDTLFVIRGGAYNMPIAYTTAFYRAGVTASPASRQAIAYTGFRCSASLPRAGGR
jgi:formylglycine-generating enzyme required for sulfatase activity